MIGMSALYEFLSRGILSTTDSLLVLGELRFLNCHILTRDQGIAAA
jgi:hypothetical protein